MAPVKVSNPVGDTVPIPKRLFVLSQNKLALSSSKIPDVPANNTEPAVGANHVGAPEPKPTASPDTNACPCVPNPDNAKAVAELYTTAPLEAVRAAFEPPLSIFSIPVVSLRATPKVEVAKATTSAVAPVLFPRTVLAATCGNIERVRAFEPIENEEGFVPEQVMPEEQEFEITPVLVIVGCAPMT